MKKLISFLFVAVGLLNFVPIIGALSADQLTSLYGLSIDSADLETLMRHRAVMLGLIGGLLLFAAFHRPIQVISAIVGLVSMSSFVLIAYLAGEIGPEIGKVVVADIIGSAAAALVLVLAIKEHSNAP